MTAITRTKQRSIHRSVPRGDAAGKPARDEKIGIPAGDRDFMTSLARGLAVISAFSGLEGSLTIAELSRVVGLSRAAVRRCLYTLEQLGYAGSDDRGFFLKPKILGLGYAYLSSNQIAVTAQPLLDRVSGLVQESCSLATLSGEEIVYVARASTSQRIMSIHISVGTRLPAYCTSMGRVLLADLSAAELDSYLARTELRELTERTVNSREKLRQILLGVRRSGYAIVDQELEIGLRSVAVPVRGSTGAVAAAMNVGTQAARFSVREIEAKILPPLRAAADELSALLR